MNDKNKEISVSLLAFTVFYSVAIYILLIGFYFWHWHKQDGRKIIIDSCLPVTTGTIENSPTSLLDCFSFIRTGLACREYR
jgi:hypothetical protein